MWTPPGAFFNASSIKAFGTNEWYSFNWKTASCPRHETSLAVLRLLNQASA
jgi:hypothetical protein